LLFQLKASDMQLTLSDKLLTIRECSGLDDFEKCLALQRDIWQFSDLDITPLRMYIISARCGGFTFGAFDETNELIGFAHALPMVEGIKLYYYSHMLAVRRDYQNSGLGRYLKLAQRDRALPNGVPLIVWTFDPLQSRNAYFNFEKLGVVTNSYKVNYYGSHSTSTLHAGLDTDRLFVYWWIASQRVANRISGKRQQPQPNGPTIQIPDDIQMIKEKDIELAREWQLRVRQQFQELFQQGYYCVGFRRIAGGLGEYLFGEDWQEDED